MVKKSGVRIFNADSITKLESVIEFVLNHTEGYYIQSISISHVEGLFYAAVVFNKETEDESK